VEALAKSHFTPHSLGKGLRDLFPFAEPEPELDSSGRGGNLCCSHKEVSKGLGPLKWRGWKMEVNLQVCLLSAVDYEGSISRLL